MNRCRQEKPQEKPSLSSQRYIKRHPDKKESFQIITTLLQSKTSENNKGIHLKGKSKLFLFAMI